MKKRILIGLGIAALVVGGTVYAANRQGAFHGRFGQRLMAHIARRLDLTDAQQAQIKSIIQDERQKAAPLLVQAASNRAKLREATTGGKFDEAQVRPLANQQAQTLAELIVTRERVKSRIYTEVLTPEQRTKADQLLEDMHKHFTERFTTDLP